MAKQTRGVCGLEHDMRHYKRTEEVTNVLLNSECEWQAFKKIRSETSAIISNQEATYGVRKMLCVILPQCVKSVSFQCGLQNTYMPAIG